MPNWDRIVDQHAQHVFRVAFRILGRAEAAEDVAQEVFTEAFRLQKAERVENWTALFVRLATLRSLDHLRRRRPSEQLREGDTISRLEPIDAAAANELADRMRLAISDLPAQQAAVFVMSYFEQLSRAEIGVSLGISPEAVSTALHKARQRLLELLAIVRQGESK